MSARALTALAAAIVLAAACSSSTDGAGPESTTSTSADVAASPTTATTTSTVPPPEAPVLEPARHPITARTMYFVLPDRFANGNPSNDAGGLVGGPLETGFLPEDTGFHHGGDLVGLTERLPYLAEMGVGAIWITPPFTNKTVQGDGTIEGSSSGYHGYWQIDWDRVDPHLGTEQELQDLIAAAHELDMLVLFDVVVNHTGDVIGFAEDRYGYVSTDVAPYLDAAGDPFDPADVAGDADFPDLTIESFPYTPVAAAGAKSPDWLNDLTLYHNRGNTTFSGESDTYGDFFGLDDLFTEHPRVVEGMTELHSSLIERYGIDGFRIDTMKHVNHEFWEVFAPAIAEAASGAGRPDFFAFGEVNSTSAILKSSFTDVGVQGTLDFIVSDALEQYIARGAGAQVMVDAFDDDDWFTDTDTNASMQMTFFGNHDMGRMGYLIDRGDASADEATKLDRMELGLDLLFTTRGAPIVYYGDEQGFVGTGGDQLARQDMFPTLTPEYADDDSIGSDSTPAEDNFDPTHPLYERIRALTDLRVEHPTLVTGAQIVHLAQDRLFAFSRFDRFERVEYVVASNAGSEPGSIAIEVDSADASFEPIWGNPAAAPLESAGTTVTIDVPPLSVIVLRATAPTPPPDSEATVRLVRPLAGAEIMTSRYRFEAEVSDGRYAEVTFAVSVDGADPEPLGVDDAPPYRVYWNNSELPAGATVEVFATVVDGSGRTHTDRASATVAERP